MNTWFRLTLVVVLLLVMVGGAAAQEESLDDLGAALDALVPGLLEENRVPGVAIAVIHDGEVVWSQGYGLADIESETPMSADTPFLVASLSKIVTSGALLGLAEAGELDLDTPVQDTLTRWQFPESAQDISQVTLRRILSHTAGLSTDGYAGYAPEEPLPTLEGMLSGEGADPVLLFMPPGRMHMYSGGGYSVAQLLIEEVTGQSYADFMVAQVFEPLGMANSVYTLDTSAPADAATGYDNSGNPLPYRVHLDLAAGGLYTSAPDLARYLAATFPGGDFLSAESAAQIYTPAEVRNESYGFGAYIVPLDDGAVGAWHDGINQGYRTVFAVIPESGEGIVVLTNSGRGHNVIDDIVCAWDEWLAEDARDLCRAV